MKQIVQHHTFVQQLHDVSRIVLQLSLTKKNVHVKMVTFYQKMATTAQILMNVNLQTVPFVLKHATTLLVDLCELRFVYYQLPI